MTPADRKAILKAIERFTSDVVSSPEMARAVLVAEGIYLENGELAPEYRAQSAASPTP